MCTLGGDALALGADLDLVNSMCRQLLTLLLYLKELCNRIRTEAYGKGIDIGVLWRRGRGRMTRSIIFGWTQH